MKHAYPYTIAIPHRFPATIWPGVDHDVHDLHASITIESDDDARREIMHAINNRTHQWSLIVALLESQLDAEEEEIWR